MESPVVKNEIVVHEFLLGGGEMGKLIRNKDWSKTPLGSTDSWPESLRTTVSLYVAYGFPISIAWGPHRVRIYNGRYWQVMGDKHQTSMGQNYKECLLSAWPTIDEWFEAACLEQSRFLESQQMSPACYGYLEETFFISSFFSTFFHGKFVNPLYYKERLSICKLAKFPNLKNIIARYIGFFTNCYNRQPVEENVVLTLL